MYLRTMSLLLVFKAVGSTYLRSSLHSTRERQLEKQREKICPTGRNERHEYKIKPDERYSETSYIAYSLQKYKGNPVLWMGSDGEQNEINAVDMESGETIWTYKLNVRKDGDWESISLGPCNQTAEITCIYIGKTGNNPAHKCDDRKCKEGRYEVEIFKFNEPNINLDRRSKLEVTTLVINYDHKDFPTSRADSEALFVDYIGDTKGGNPGDIYLVTKWFDDRELQRLGKISVKEHENLGFKKYKVDLKAVGKPYGEHVWTGADMRTDGKLIALRDLKKVYFFSRLRHETVADALKTKACPFESETKRGKDFNQFEAVAMMGKNVGEASECKGKKKCKVEVAVYELEYKNSDADEGAKIEHDKGDREEDTVTYQTQYKVANEQTGKDTKAQNQDQQTEEASMEEMSAARKQLCPIGRGDRTDFSIKKNDDFEEVAYMTYSDQTHNGNPVLWMGSSGDKDELSAVDMTTGETIRKYELNVEKEGDWESISLGPCSEKNDRTCIYVGNTGDNDARSCDDRECDDGRDEVLIYKIGEPNVEDNTTSKLSATTLVLDYEDEHFPTRKADSEALFIDRSGDENGGKRGDIYLVTKWDDKDDRHLGRIGKISVGQHENLDENAYKVDLQAVGQPYGGKDWSGAEMRQDGKLIALRDSDKIYFYPRMHSETVADALRQRPCSFESESKRDGDEFETVTMIGPNIAEVPNCDGSCGLEVSVYELEYNTEKTEEQTKQKTKTKRYEE